MNLQAFQTEAVDVFRVAKETDERGIEGEALHLHDGRQIVFAIEPQNKVVACGVHGGEEGDLQVAEFNVTPIARL